MSYTDIQGRWTKTSKVISHPLFQLRRQAGPTLAVSPTIAGPLTHTLTGTMWTRHSPPRASLGRGRKPSQTWGQRAHSTHTVAPAGRGFCFLMDIIMKWRYWRTCCTVSVGRRKSCVLLFGSSVDEEFSVCKSALRERKCISLNRMLFARLMSIGKGFGNRVETTRGTQTTKGKRVGNKGSGFKSERKTFTLWWDCVY